MENSSHSYVRIESAKFGKRGMAYTSVVFIISFIVCAIIGATGPEVLQSRSDGANLVINELGFAEWQGILQDMTPLNQMFWLSCLVQRNDTYFENEDIYTLDININVTGHDAFYISTNDEENVVTDMHTKRSVYCNANSIECDEFFMFGQNTIKYRRYTVLVRLKIVQQNSFHTEESLPVKFRLNTINAEYSKFELGWKAFFAFTTFIALFLPEEGFLVKLWAVPGKLWSIEQKWVLQLLILLFFFNGPFFAAQLYTTQVNFMALFDIVLTSLFLANLLLFWLCTLDEMRNTESVVVSIETGKRQSIQFYLPKAILLGIIWGMLVATFSYVRTQRDGDPTYEGLDDNILRAAELVLVLLLSVYLVYLFSLLAINLSRLRALSPPFQFLFAITLTVYGVVFLGLFAGYYYPLASSATIFLSFYAVMNLYIWTLAFAFAPQGDDDGYAKADAMFGEDYFDDAMEDFDNSSVTSGGAIVLSSSRSV